MCERAQSELFQKPELGKWLESLAQAGLKHRAALNPNLLGRVGSQGLGVSLL